MIKNNQKGQTLLFVIVAMTIALSIAINVSVRTITSLSRSTRTDTASRALAAAEGGIERYLGLSGPQYEEASSGGCPVGTLADGGGCNIEFTGVDISSLATVFVERYFPTFYSSTITNGEIKEINLFDATSGFYASDTVKICFNSLNGGSALTYVSYSETALTSQGIIVGDNPPGGTFDSNNAILAVDAVETGFDNCAFVNLGSNQNYGLRIKSVGSDSLVGVFGKDISNNTFDLPLQGYEITSRGTLVEESGVTATKEIKIIRSLPYLPAHFDYALYTSSVLSK